MHPGTSPGSDMATAFDSQGAVLEVGDTVIAHEDIPMKLPAHQTKVVHIDDFGGVFLDDGDDVTPIPAHVMPDTRWVKQPAGETKP